jgi:hypothetical protein
VLAVRCWNLLARRDGTCEWAGLPLIAGLLGITDIDGLVTRLHTIKTHSSKKDET